MSIVRFILLLNFLLLTSCKDIQYQVHYISFDVDFFVPVQEKDVEKNAQKVFMLKSPVIDKVIEKISRKNGIAAQSGDFRIKIEAKGTNKFIFIDHDKIIWFKERRYPSIDSSGLINVIETKAGVTTGTNQCSN